jgi:hypothetical protein
MIMELRELQAIVHQTALDHGWWDKPREFGDIIALMHTELSEAYEKYREGHAVQDWWFTEDKPEGVPIELVDVVIRILDFFGHEGLDLNTLVQIKDSYNGSRPYRHGDKVT